MSGTRSRFAGSLLLLCVVSVLVGAIASVVSAAETDTPDLEQLREEYRLALEQKDDARALELAEEIHWVTAEPYIDAVYELAAFHARLGHEDEAYEWLGKCLDAGFWDFRRLKTDEIFAALREQERFKTMVQGAWAKQYIAMLEREEREGFQQPDRVMRTLDFQAGETVADIGAGSGYFTVRVARAVGIDGKVWAMDIRQPMLDFIENRLVEETIENVELRLVPKDDPLLPTGGVDTILMVDTWHYIRDPAYAKKLRRGLAPGGRLVVIDYRPRPWEERPWGPPPVQQTPREELDAHMAEAGLRPVRVHDYLSEQYFVEYEAAKP